MYNSFIQYRPSQVLLQHHNFSDKYALMVYVGRAFASADKLEKKNPIYILRFPEALIYEIRLALH